MRSNRRAGQPVRLLAAGVCTVVLLFPIYWMAVSSVTPRQELMTSNPGLVPHSFSLDHYRRVFTQSNFPTFLANSAKVATAVTLLVIPLAFSGGYALSRHRFCGRRLFGMTLLGTQMLPAIMLAVPLYKTMSALGLVDTHTSLVICYTTFALPFTTWMMRGFFEGLPREIEECAQIDGCNRLVMLWRVVLPLCTPGLVATAILAFLLAWNEYMFALLLINSANLKTFPVGIQTFLEQWRVDYGALMAASMMVSVPVSALFLLLQRYLVTGLTAGSLKG